MKRRSFLARLAAVLGITIAPTELYDAPKPIQSKHYHTIISDDLVLVVHTDEKRVYGMAFEAHVAEHQRAINNAIWGVTRSGRRGRPSS